MTHFCTHGIWGWTQLQVTLAHYHTYWQCAKTILTQGRLWELLHSQRLFLKQQSGRVRTREHFVQMQVEGVWPVYSQEAKIQQFINGLTVNEVWGSMLEASSMIQTTLCLDMVLWSPEKKKILLGIVVLREDSCQERWLFPISFFYKGFPAGETWHFMSAWME